jgi:hypothetical protein
VEFMNSYIYRGRAAFVTANFQLRQVCGTIISVRDIWCINISVSEQRRHDDDDDGG